jgi:hypothetical protein
MIDMNLIIYLGLLSPISCNIRITFLKFKVWFNAAWNNWRPAGHIRPETSYNQTREFIFFLLTNLFSLLGMIWKIILIPIYSAAIDFKTL